MALYIDHMYTDYNGIHWNWNSAEGLFCYSMVCR